MREFIREERYAVLKISDMTEALTHSECQELIYLENKIRAYRESQGKKELECVVVESDWPEYEPTWTTIQNRVLGVTPKLDYFVYDSNSGFETFSNETDRNTHAEDCIQGYLDDGWDEEVTTVCSGIITHETIQTDLVKRPDIIDEEGHDGNGDWWDSEWDYKCNYALAPIDTQTKDTSA